MEEYRRTEVLSGRYVDGKLVAVDEEGNPTGDPISVEWFSTTTYRSKCSETTVVDLPPAKPEPPFPASAAHWRREGQQRQRTESDLRAFQKRVEKRRAKKKRK